MKTETRKLLLEIAKCKEGGCESIINYQKDYFENQDDYQIPEPWNGNIEEAEIMFITLNPSFKKDESRNDSLLKFPQRKELDKEDYICDFFTNRFKEIADGKERKERKNFSWHDERCWYSLNKWTSWILGCDGEEHRNHVYLGERAVISDLVHCKSRKSAGVIKSRKICVKWLNEIVKLFASSNGKYLILVGKDFFDNDNYDIVYKIAKQHDIQICRTTSYVNPGKGYTDKIRKKELRNDLELKLKHVNK